MNKMTAEQYQAIAGRAECLVSPTDVDAALQRMCDAIGSRLGDKDPVVLAVMTGGIVATGLLLPRLDFALRLDYVHATRYRGGTRGGEIEWRHRPVDAVRGEHVLVIDDIFDEGLTMETIVKACHEDGAASVISAVLVEKERVRDCDYRPDIVGLQVPDRYVMGFGLDYKSYFRNADRILAADPTDI
ncbi:hypoxanthine-guanine phosphoribosyltransferase [Lamprobacter modestohalophilus]|uniref:hypoxanthine-guanine phosphoribosyltransferase n=1 Tax=Lamprobacter modestohalophilus TaxID=1064514 RepID=UPI002ADEC450|nr:hypoxanthine-guanine phosphoribosyltransferase [Lamprobacter modestohalophilus]MEA1050367.1 hypoxanthine-guanine phosphoribosyltransferase [Lamprobacter modestohalophilus]